MTARLASLLDDVEVLEVVGGDTGRVEVTSVTQDSRSVIEGSLYCCVPGSRIDGHDLAAEVVGAGARSLLVERWVDAAVPQVRVESTRRAIAPVAAAFFGRPSHRLSVVGVTGTNGKTTTTHLLASVLRTAGRRTGVIGTLSGARTTPEAPVLQARLAEFLEAGCEAVAMEVSSQALHQHRADAIEFTVAVWTNLSQDHLDYHGNVEAYFEAKARLFERERCRLAVVNGDDEWGRKLLTRLDVPFTTYERAAAGEIRTGLDGTRFDWNGHEVLLPLAGLHNVSNALAAATAARGMGVTDELIAEGLSSSPPVPGRWERVDEGQPFAVIVDYAHTPDGLDQALRAARDATAGTGRVIVVFGCGGDRDRSKRPQMAAVATARADVAILTSDNPRHEDPAAILAEAATGATGGALRIEPDRDTAIGMAVAEARAGDLVVVAGKGHETGQIVGDVVLPFDDREVARRRIRERMGSGR